MEKGFVKLCHFELSCKIHVIGNEETQNEGGVLEMSPSHPELSLNTPDMFRSSWESRRSF